MKRFREGYVWKGCAIGMVSRWSKEEGLVLVPWDQETGQVLMRFMVE